METSRSLVPWTSLVKMDRAPIARLQTQVLQVQAVEGVVLQVARVVLVIFQERNPNLRMGRVLVPEKVEEVEEILVVLGVEQVILAMAKMASLVVSAEKEGSPTVLRSL